MALSRPTDGRVLALRGLGLGDLCTAVPALRGIRRAFPRHELLLAAPDPLAPLALAAGVDEVIPCRGPQLEETSVAELVGSVDVAINLHGRGPESTRSLRRLRSPRLMSFRGPDDPPWCGPEWRAAEHDRARWCRMLAHWSIWADPADLHLTAAEPPNRSSGRPVAVVHPGAASPARRWPPERFAAVASMLCSDGMTVVLVGDRSERALCEHVAAMVLADAPTASVEVVAGRTDVAALMSIVAEAAVVVCNDSGVAHLASAHRTPSVVLFGPVPPSSWGPPEGPHVALWAGRHGDPHASVLDPGLERITVHEVCAAFQRVRRQPVGVGA